jgi:quercetin dioxygenase-like cupin family protein
MKIHNLDDFTRGWFVGNFDPSLIKLDEIEVAVQRFKKGDYEPKHVHNVATEMTVIVSGRAEMSGIEYAEGDIVEIKPGNATDFRAIEDTITVVVKTPCVPSDKYLLD